MEFLLEHFLLIEVVVVVVLLHDLVLLLLPILLVLLLPPLLLLPIIIILFPVHAIGILLPLVLVLVLQTTPVVVIHTLVHRDPGLTSRPIHLLPILLVLYLGYLLFVATDEVSGQTGLGA